MVHLCQVATIKLGDSTDKKEHIYNAQFKFGQSLLYAHPLVHLWTSLTEGALHFYNMDLDHTEAPVLYWPGFHVRGSSLVMRTL